MVFEAKRGWDVGLNRSSACVLRVFFQSRFSLGEVAQHTCSRSGVKMQQLIFVSGGRGGEAAGCCAAKDMSSLWSVTYQLKSQFAPKLLYRHGPKFGAIAEHFSLLSSRVAERV